jgi:hypothetical protein
MPVRRLARLAKEIIANLGALQEGKEAPSFGIVIFSGNRSHLVV